MFDAIRKFLILTSLLLFASVVRAQVMTPAVVLNSSGTTLSTWYVTGYPHTNGVTIFANKEYLAGVVIPVSLSGIGHITFQVTTGDSVGTDLYSVGLYNSSGTAICTTTAAAYTTAAVEVVACSQGSSLSIPAGNYYIGFTGEATTAALESDDSPSFYSVNASFANTTSGAQPSSITPPSNSWTMGTQVIGFGLTP